MKCKIPDSPGATVLKVVIKTRPREPDRRNALVKMRICDLDQNCCDTSPDLYQPEINDQEPGQVHVFTNTTILGNCSQEVIKTFPILFDKFSVHLHCDYQPIKIAVMYSILNLTPPRIY